MAIGDTLNQNPFGTDYNAEDEERKKAELAAQGARIGAEGVPALDSNIVSLVPGIKNIRNPGAFDPTNIEPVEPASSELGYFQRLGEFAKSVLNRDQGLFDVDRLGTAADDLLGSAMRNLTPAEDRRFSNNEPFGKTFTDTFAITRPDGTKFYPDEVTPPAEATQAPSEASALQATQGVTPPVERPTAGAQEQPGAVVSPFLQSPDTPSGLGGPLLRGFEMVNDAARGPNAPMGQDATRAALGGMTLNEYLNAPAGTPGVSGLRTDPQGRMITPTPPLRVEPEVVQPPVDSVVPTEVAQPPVDALSSFEKDSLARQQRIGGTGSFEGDSEARDARVREMDRRPGESQADRDTRVAQSKTTGGQTGGLSFDDARRRAEGDLAERGVKNPSASQVNALARSIQAGEPERLAELETKRALDAIKLRDAEAKKDFKPQIVEIGDQKLIQLSPNYYQPVRPKPTAEEPFEPRVLEDGGFTYYEVAPNRFERQPSTKAGGAAGEVSSAIADAIAAGGEEVATTPAPTVDTPEAATGDEFTPQQELGIQKVMADNEITREKAIEELRKAGKLK